MDLATDLASEWVRCRDWLLPALQRGSPFITEAQLIDQMIAGEYHLHGRERAAVVYAITAYPAARAFVFVLAGGDLQELKNIEAELIERAKLLRCDRVEFCGRRGWVRALGYEEIYTIGVKDLDDG